MNSDMAYTVMITTNFVIRLQITSVRLLHIKDCRHCRAVNL